MPTANETYDHVCDGTWQEVAGAGWVAMTVDEAKGEVRFATAAAGFEPDTRGHPMPAPQNYRQQGVMFEIKDGKTMWLRGPEGSIVVVTPPALPA